MATVVELAREAHECFEVATREETGHDFIRVKEGSPDWLRAMMLAAHNNGEWFPDDWRYRCAMEACEFIGAEGHEDEPDDEWAHDFADGKVDIYTPARVEWLASSPLRRGAYVDKTRDEGLISSTADLVDLIGAGQYEEAYEVFHLVHRFLMERAGEFA